MRTITICLFALLGLFFLGSQIEKKRRGDLAHPVSLPPKSLSRIILNDDKIEKTTVNVRALTKHQEPEEVFCVLVNNQSEFALTEIECEVKNLRSESRDIFMMRPVTGKWLPRDGYRKYFAEPKGIQKWSGDFGDRLNLNDSFQIRILKAYGFRP